MRRFDRSDKILGVLLGLTLLCLTVMALHKLPLILANKDGPPQAIPIVWIFPLAIIGPVASFFLRNFRGLLSLLSCGLIAGGTVMTVFFANAFHRDLDISWSQSILCLVVTFSTLNAINRMDVDFANIGIEDLFN